MKYDEELKPDQVAYLHGRAAETRKLWKEHDAKLKAAIAREIYVALERLEAPPELLSIVGSWGDTLDDSEVLRLLQDYNATGKVMHERQ